MNDKIPLLASLWVLGFAGALAAQDEPPVAKTGIEFLHAKDDAIPAAAPGDERPTILYFTFDT